MEYKNYSLEDFLSDDSFLQWVKHPDEANQTFWKNWLKQHPEKLQTVEEARGIILSLQFENAEITEERIIEMQETIHGRIGNSPVIPISKKPKMFLRYWVAASLFLTIVSSGLFFFLNTQTTEWVTDFGETKTVFLPDSSRVMLNANSKISYNNTWAKGNREVFLEGEAFFEVKKLPSEKEGIYRKFIVHSGELNVEVLGTTFNVFHRRGATEIVLNTGKVKVSDTGNANVMMQPGERVIFKENEFTKEIVNPKEFIAWKENQLIFNKTPLFEIIQLLEDNYDYEVILQDEKLAQMKFIGTFPADDISILIQTLAKSVQVDIAQKKIIIGAKR